MGDEVEGEGRERGGNLFVFDVFHLLDPPDCREPVTSMRQGTVKLVDNHNRLAAN